MYEIVGQGLPELRGGGEAGPRLSGHAPQYTSVLKSAAGMRLHEGPACDLFEQVGQLWLCVFTHLLFGHVSSQATFQPRRAAFVGTVKLARLFPAPQVLSAQVLHDLPERVFRNLVE